MGIKYAGGQPQDGVQIGILKEFPSNRFTGPAFKQHIARNDHGRLVNGFGHGAKALGIASSFPKSSEIAPKQGSLVQPIVQVTYQRQLENASTFHYKW